MFHEILSEYQYLQSVEAIQQKSVLDISSIALLKISCAKLSCIYFQSGLFSCLKYHCFKLI